MRKIVRDEKGYCLIHPNELANPKCQICLSIYNKKYQRKYHKKRSLQSNNSTTSSFYKKIKKMGYDKTYILVMGIHSNPVGVKNSEEVTRTKYYQQRS